MTVVAALTAAVATEHQVVYGYGVAGAHLSGPARAVARAALAAHQLRRDRLAQLLTSERITAPLPAVAYALPFPVMDAASARRLCAELETACTGAAWDLVAAAAASTPARALGVDWLGDAATRAAYWGDGSAAPSLPGRPG
jgi:hypothetical protein